MKKFFKRYWIYPDKLFVDRIYVLIEIMNIDDRNYISTSIEYLVKEGVLRRGWINLDDESYWKNPFLEKYDLHIPHGQLSTNFSIYMKPRKNSKAKRQGL